jgi:hypothetical protein
MQDQQMAEFILMSRDVVRRLRTHAYLDTQNVRHVFQFLELPSFTQPVAWDVFRRFDRSKGDEYLLVRTTWQQDLDAAKLDTPVERLKHPYPLTPTIQAHQLRVKSAVLAELVEKLGKVEIILGTSGGIGLDGTFYEVAIEQTAGAMEGGATVRVRWWGTASEQWKGMAAWHTRAQEVFYQAWAKRQDEDAKPAELKVIEDNSRRAAARQLFSQGLYAQAAELLAEIETRTPLSAVEAKMLKIALGRMGR